VCGVCVWEIIKRRKSGVDGDDLVVFERKLATLEGPAVDQIINGFAEYHSSCFRSAASVCALEREILEVHADLRGDRDRHGEGFEIIARAGHSGG
jgi:hypothetical protein